MIKISNLTKYFDGHRVLDNVNLEIKDGEFFCLMGASGEGKTVFLQHVIGLLKADTGSVNIDGIDITKLAESKQLRLRRNFGYLFQEGALFDYMDVYDNLALPVREHTEKTEEEIKKMINDVLSKVELENVESKFPRQLSGGMRKRVGLARAIILKPKILLCDEPTAGLDPATGLAIARLILKICRDLNTTTLVVSHDVKNFFSIADRIAIINKGSIIAIGTKDEIKNSNNPILERFLLMKEMIR